MKRMLLLMAVYFVVAAMMVAMAMPAFAAHGDRHGFGGNFDGGGGGTGGTDVDCPQNGVGEDSVGGGGGSGAKSGSGGQGCGNLRF